MTYGRVIGNELRDVPPECLPVWGQRWSSYRAPHGPSPFSTHVFTVDGMSEVGPVLTSPSQFEIMLTDEDDGEDTSSESNRFYGSFHVHVGAIELASRPKTPTPQSVHLLSNRPHDTTLMVQRSSGHPPPLSPTYFTSRSLRGRQSEQSSNPHHSSEPVLRPAHTTPIQYGHEPPSDGFGLWDMGSTSPDTLPRAGPSHPSFVPTGQSQYTMPPESVPQFFLTRSHPYPANLSPNSGNNYLLQVLPDDIQGFVPSMPPSSLHRFDMPPDQQNVGVHSYDSSTTRISDMTHPRNPMTTQWQSASVSPTLEFHPGPPETSGSPSLGSALAFHRSISDRRNSYSQNLSNICPIEGSTLPPFGDRGSGQFSR